MLDTLPNEETDEYMKDVRMDENFSVLRIACSKSGQPKLIQTALVIIEKLISSDLLVGDGLAECDCVSTTVALAAESGSETPELKTPPLLDRRVIDLVVDTVCSTLKGQEDDEIHLLIIRCILSMVLSPNRLIHGVSLMTCVRTLYAVNKDSKSATVQSTAVAALTQMLNTLIVRMEEAHLQPPVSVETIRAFSQSYSRSLLNKTVLLSDPDNLNEDNRGLHGWCVNCGLPAEHFCISTREPVCSYACKRSHACKVKGDTKSTPGVTSSGKLSMEYQDVICVFASLCKLSAASQPSAAASIPDMRIVKGKRLSLELISTMLESSGSVLKSDPQFLDIIKRNLFVSLLTNSVSPVPRIFTIALLIFEQLIRDFKTHLLSEIGIFIDQVFLYILESENASFLHKLKVLEVFRSQLCSDCKSALQLFQLFDCRMNERNVFELCVTAISGIVTKKSTLDPSGQLELVDQEMQLKRAALASLIALINSTAAWVEAQTTPSASTPEEPPRLEESGEFGGGFAKQRKILLQQALDLFRTKPNKGVDLLVEHKFVESADPAVVASFLKHTITIDKTGLGEFLGENKPFNLSVFYAFVDLFEFKNLELDVALRQFLSHFRLPGEAQKIDRIMEKFAEKFCTENPGRYPSADSAYVLSFAVIMLNTDLHSPQIKKKMSLEEFVKLGKGINTEIEISPAELARLYRNIEAEPISLSEDDELRAKVGNVQVSPQRRRFEQFIKETGQMIERTKTQMTRKRELVGEAATVQEVPGMLQVVVVPIRDALGAMVGFDEPTEIECVETAVKASRISFHFDQPEICAPFVSLLLDWAVVETKDRFIREKNLLAMEHVLRLAAESGVGVEGWPRLAKLLSVLDKFCLIQFESVGQTKPPAFASSAMARILAAPAWLLSPPTPQIYSELERANAALVCEAVPIDLVDAVIVKSGNLTPANLLAFVGSLIEVSTSCELGESRLFCTQKLAELADFNMGRMRLVWAKLWALIAPFFVLVALSPAPQLSAFAIDSLRQLALKFLSKPELHNYHFQAEFLRPFAQIMAAPHAQDLILSVVDSLVRSVVLKSGWISVFQILQIAAEAKGVVAAFDLLTFIHTSLHPIEVEYFREYFSVLIGLIKNREREREGSGLSSKTWALLDSNLDLLTQTPIPADAARGLYLSVFRGLASLVTDSMAEVRDRAISTLTRLTPADSETVQIYLRAVLTPLFDDITQMVAEGRLAGDVAVNILDQLTAQLVLPAQFLPELLGLYSILVRCKEREKISAIGVAALRRLILVRSGEVRSGEVRSERGSPTITMPTHSDSWTLISTTLCQLISDTLPTGLMQCGDLSQLTVLPFRADEMVNTCVAQLNLLQLIADIVDSEQAVSLEALSRFTGSLEQSYEFACSFNAELQLRDKLKRLGFMKDLRQLPGLLKQERASVSTIIKLLFLTNSPKLEKYCTNIVDAYLSKEAQLQSIAVQVRDSLSDEIEREIHGLVSLVSVVILGGFADMVDEDFSTSRKWVFALVAKLVCANNLTTRQAVRRCLEARFAP